MTDLPEAQKIALEYIANAGYEGGIPIEVKDKIYKWAVELQTKMGRFIVEVSKTAGTVLKLIKL